MKPLLLPFAWFLIISAPCAQDVLENDKLWYEASVHWITQAYSERLYRIDGDTIINNLSYKTLSYSPVIPNPQWSPIDTFLREDADRVVYMLDPSGQEGILYDMGIQAGEEVTLYNGTKASYKEEKEVLHHGVWRTEIRVSIYSPDTTCIRNYWWVEGIGGRNALFPVPCHPSFENVYTGLNCVAIGGQLLYSDNGYGCLTTTSNENLYQPILFETYPNPVTDQLTVRLTESSETEMYISLCNLQGQVIHAQNTSTPYQEMDMSPWPSGMYILRVQSASGGEGFRKLVKL